MSVLVGSPRAYSSSYTKAEMDARYLNKTTGGAVTGSSYVKAASGLSFNSLSVESSAVSFGHSPVYSSEDSTDVNRFEVNDNGLSLRLGDLDGEQFAVRSGGSKTVSPAWVTVASKIPPKSLKENSYVLYLYVRGASASNIVGVRYRRVTSTGTTPTAVIVPDESSYDYTKDILYYSVSDDAYSGCAMVEVSCEDDTIYGTFLSDRFVSFDVQLSGTCSVGCYTTFGRYPLGQSLVGNTNYHERWNSLGTRNLFVVGDGTSSARSNSFAVDETGQMWFGSHDTPAGWLYSNGAKTNNSIRTSMETDTYALVSANLTLVDSLWVPAGTYIVYMLGNFPATSSGSYRRTNIEAWYTDGTNTGFIARHREINNSTYASNLECCKAFAFTVDTKLEMYASADSKATSGNTFRLIAKRVV